MNAINFGIDFASALVLELMSSGRGSNVSSYLLLGSNDESDILWKINLDPGSIESGS